jgi:hypothetical protein
MSQNGCFFHAYLGSLDKTLVESTMLRVPVISINPEYIKVFGKWGVGDDLTLGGEYRAMRNMRQEEIDQELLRRYKIAQKHHSLENWLVRLSQILQ